MMWENVILCLAPCVCVYVCCLLLTPEYLPALPWLWSLYISSAYFCAHAGVQYTHILPHAHTALCTYCPMHILPHWHTVPCTYLSHAHTAPSTYCHAATHTHVSAYGCPCEPDLLINSRRMHSTQHSNECPCLHDGVRCERAHECLAPSA